MLRVAECSHSANVWTHENRISSDSQTREICLPGLPPNALELIGKLVKVDGLTKLNGIFKHPTFKPESKVTTDGFDQTVLYSTLHSVPYYLMNFGFNIPAVIAKRRGAEFKITGHANGTNQLNAWYSPQSGEMTFGTYDDKWHLASDSDVSSHEEGHLILDHYHPGFSGWYTGEGGAIHEGYADALAGGYFNDAEMSEDFAPHKGRPESKEDGLRVLDNDLTLDDVTKEVHDRGRVYGAFFWSIKKALKDPKGPFNLSDREAADVMLKILINHGANYRTSRPEPKDFVDAVLTGMTALASEGKLGVDPGKLGAFIQFEAIKRKMIKAPDETTPPKASFPSVGSVENYLAKIGIRTKFVKSHEAGFIGGVFEVYQQHIITDKFGPVEAVGRSILIQRNRWGSIVSLSVKDILPLKPDQIDESGNIDLRTAIELALSHAKDGYKKVDLELRDLYHQMRDTRNQIPVQKLAEIQMEHEISRTDLITLRRIYKLIQTRGQLKHRIVLIDGSTVPHYEFKTGLSIYYVNTISGKVTKYKDVVVN